ncbi:hypothetical protein GF380_02185 [Candidatus Uhrbacteria bacterium]|nr:hypothetical protein [Candidatus Uhrbacteria bacterium]MBD3284025.1 hypothetical protein [Candidatus Uhrbacteria bacterium]
MASEATARITVMPNLAKKGVFTLSWGLFLTIVAAAALIATGIPIGPITIIAGVVGVFFAFNYPYATFGLLVLLIPFLGFTVSIPAGAVPLAQEAFGGSIDIYVGEVVAIVLLIAWILRVLFLWVRRQDVNWKPWLPLFWPAMAIVATHLLSALSPLNSDVVLSIKYAMRPVFWSYLIYVVLTVNFVQSPRRVRMVLGLVIVTGLLAALMGFASLAFFPEAGVAIPRARPLPMFGTNPLGLNHHLLAEWLSFSVMACIAMVYLSKSKRAKRLLILAAVFQAVIALLTFARSLWIVFALQAVLLGYLVWKEELRKYVKTLLIIGLLLLPLIAVMIEFSSSAVVQGSTSSRLMLTEIALNFWAQSPWIGAGAGTFVTLVDRTAVFFIEFGNPMDAHGWIQKLLAEVGLLGLMAVGWMAVAAYRFLRDQIRSFKPSPERTALIVLSIAVFGAAFYQLFNTNYWTGKIWFPLGIAIACTYAFRKHRTHHDEAPLDT